MSHHHIKNNNLLLLLLCFESIVVLLSRGWLGSRGRNETILPIYRKSPYKPNRLHNFCRCKCRALNTFVLGRCGWIYATPTTYRVWSILAVQTYVGILLIYENHISCKYLPVVRALISSILTESHFGYSLNRKSYVCR